MLRARSTDTDATLAAPRDTIVSLRTRFAPWKAMVRQVRTSLKDAGVKILSLDGNTTQRASTLTEFQSGGVLLLCLEDFAGLHLPHANVVVFAHAILGDRETVGKLERQAIARCARRGQQAEVEVYSFVVAECAEESQWRKTRF